MPPHYNGLSILNIPATVCRLLGVPVLGEHPPLDRRLTAPLGEAERVVLVLVDGMRWDLLRQALEAGLLPGWERLAEEGILAPLTSIAPSTTAAALTTLWTGQSPAEHGVMG
ncbi:MAG: alkaline phosphatase family protein, partial [Chloroflexi bacterium]|nr:alkaline phosphatase family protein [Chloroflexota bacterium]